MLTVEFRNRWSNFENNRASYPGTKRSENRTMEILFRTMFNTRALSLSFFFFGKHMSKKRTSTISLQFNCCGIHGYGDYNGTAWWRDAQISGNRRQVPLTCCVLKNTEVWRIYCCECSNPIYNFLDKIIEIFNNILETRDHRRVENL